jgi:hypothetical protein
VSRSRLGEEPVDDLINIISKVQIIWKNSFKGKEFSCICKAEIRIAHDYCPLAGTLIHYMYYVTNHLDLIFKVSSIRTNSCTLPIKDEIGNFRREPHKHRSYKVLFHWALEDACQMMAFADMILWVMRVEKILSYEQT